MSRVRFGKIDIHWAFNACKSMFNGIKFLPYKHIVQGEFTIWYRQSESENPEDFHVAQVWHGDDGKYHIAGQYTTIFGTLEEAKNHLDEFIVESGGIIITEKMVPFL